MYKIEDYQFDSIPKEGGNVSRISSVHSSAMFGEHYIGTATDAAVQRDSSVIERKKKKREKKKKNLFASYIVKLLLTRFYEK